MHDPMTVIKDFGRVATLWHVDPESDGSDDSCGWFTPKMAPKERERLKNLAWSEAHEPHFMAAKCKTIADPVKAEHLCRGLLLLIATRMKWRLSLDDATKLAAELIHCPSDNLKGMFCFLAGYHENSHDDTAENREYSAERLYFCVAGAIKRHNRRWWQHPRWHFWHWRLTIHPLRDFQRWAFSRCVKCGGRFSWGYAPMAGWHSAGPGWFRNAEQAYHHECVNTPMELSKGP